MAGSSMTVELEIWLQCIYWKFRVNGIEISRFDLIRLISFIPAFRSSSSTLPSSKHQHGFLMHAALDGEVHAQVPKVVDLDWTNCRSIHGAFWTPNGRPQYMDRKPCTSMIQNGCMFQSQSCVCVWCVLKNYGKSSEALHIGQSRAADVWFNAAWYMRHETFPSQKRAALDCLYRFKGQSGKGDTSLSGLPVCQALRLCMCFFEMQR